MAADHPPASRTARCADTIVLGLAAARTGAKHGMTASGADDGRRSNTGKAGSTAVGHGGRRGKFLDIGGAPARSRRAEKAA